MNYNASLLRVLNSGVNVRADREVAAKAIDTISDQQNLAASTSGDRPAFNQTHHGKIDAGIRAGISDRYADRFRNGFVVSAKLGGRLNRAITGVEHSNGGASRLG